MGNTRNSYAATVLLNLQVSDLIIEQIHILYRVANREEYITNLLMSLDKNAKTTKMRSVMFAELSSILKMNIHSVRSSSVVGSLCSP